MYHSASRRESVATQQMDSHNDEDAYVPFPMSSIHILYNQAIVGGLSVSFDPAVRIPNVPLHGGSNTLIHVHVYSIK